MKNRSKKVVTLCLSMSMIASMLSACGGEKKTDTKASEAPKATDAASATPEAKATDPASATPEAKADNGSSTPRNETLYFAGMQWGAIGDWNPMSGNSNNAMVINQVDSAKTTVYETLFMFNMMDSSMRPLLATEGKWDNDKDKLVYTVKLNKDAKFNDGSAFTADDVAYTFKCHVKYGSSQGNDFGLFIDKVVAKDPQTVEFYAKKNKDGKAKNPGKIEQYCTQVYQMSKAYLQKVEQRNNNKTDKIKIDKMEDCVSTGPYKKFYDDNQKQILQRDDNYWGQAKSMWGKLPAPKYLAHTFYADNNAAQTALAKGEVDITQQYVMNVQDMWLKQKLPISTYIDEAPYSITSCMPSCFFNLRKSGLDQLAVRKAIALAVDFDQINSSAMTKQSETFEQVPRSLMNPRDTEQQMIDNKALASYQWKSGDKDAANKLLDDAGIKDTDGDGIREYKGKKLSYKAECPSGWSDWNAIMTIVAAAGKEIGIQIETYFPNADTFYDDMTNGKFDIIMWSCPGAGRSNPWQRAMFYMSKDYAKLKKANWSGNFGGYVNDKAQEIIDKIPQETNKDTLKKYYTELSKIWLTDVPSFALTYRPEKFHVVNESVWTGYPENDKEQIPPTDCTDGYGIAGLYKIKNVEK